MCSCVCLCASACVSVCLCVCVYVRVCCAVPVLFKIFYSFFGKSTKFMLMNATKNHKFVCLLIYG